MSPRYQSRYQSRRAAKRIARKSKRNFIFTLVLIGFLMYAAFFWVLPFFIGGIGFLKNINNPQKPVTSTEDAAIAPPVLNIPFEATNTAQINITGFSTPDTKVKLYLDDAPEQTVDVSSDGSFNFENLSLNLGTNNIYGTTVDSNNKESLPSKTIRITYAFEKPNLTINQPEDNKKIQGGDKKVTVSGNTDIGVKIYVNGSQTIVDKDGNFSTDQPINEGDNTISIKAIDIAGNTTESQRLVNYTP